MSILLVRHGETLLNASRTVQPADTPLGPRGLAQAGALAQRLARRRIAAIVSSDLPRARQTAEAIAAACGLPIVYDALLQERNFGAWRGRPHDTLGVDIASYTEAPPGGESSAVFQARVAQAFARVAALRTVTAGDLVVVTHGLVIGAMLGAHVRLATAQTSPERLANTSVTELSATPPHTVSLLDCTAHLAGAVQDDPLSLSGA